MVMVINEVDKIEILTLQDNYVDAVRQDNTPIVSRAVPLKGMEIANTILAEHGFSSMVTVTKNGAPRSILFDFGFSDFGAAFNADALSVDFSSVEAMALSHGHLDHVGGLKTLAERVGKKDIDLYLHPSAFKNPRYLKISDDFKLYFPSFTREKAEEAGVALKETTEPAGLLDGDLLFLGEIPKKTEFETGAPNLCCEVNNEEMIDPIEDDTAIVANVKGKGLVVLSGCAHSGIVNTVNYARELTGVDKVHAVMGGFHLTGPAFEGVIEPTANALKDLNPDYVVPTHCTGRDAVNYMERAMPDKFILNMAGTKLTFAA